MFQGDESIYLLRQKFNEIKSNIQRIEERQAQLNSMDTAAMKREMNYGSRSSPMRQTPPPSQQRQTPPYEDRYETNGLLSANKSLKSDRLRLLSELNELKSINLKQTCAINRLTEELRQLKSAKSTRSFDYARPRPSTAASSPIKEKKSCIKSTHSSPKKHARVAFKKDLVSVTRFNKEDSILADKRKKTYWS